MSEIVFNVHLGEDGGYWARAVHEAIFIQGDSWDELCADALGGVEAHFMLDPDKGPASIKLVRSVKREQELLVA